jgi:hypothetical protein
MNELVALLRDVSPTIWSALMKQVYMEATLDIMWSIFWFVIATCSLQHGKKEKLEYDIEFKDGRFFKDQVESLFYYGSYIGYFISFYTFVVAIMWFVNPEFYAIRFLLQNIP